MSHATVDRAIKRGGRYTFTITGTVEELDDEFGCAQVVDDMIFHHWVYLKSAAIEVAPACEIGKLYQDSDGQIFLCRDNGWLVLGSGPVLASDAVDTASLRPINLPYDKDAW